MTGDGSPQVAGAKQRRAAARAWAASLAASTLALAGPSWAAAGRIEGLGVPAAQVRQALGDYAFRTLGGDALSIPALRGEVVVLAFWASWCNPCRRELPRLDALNTEISKRGGRVLAISIDESRENVERFVKKLALRMPVVHDGPDGLARRLDLTHLPIVIVIDRRGEVAFVTSRSDAGGLEALAGATRQALDGKPIAAWERVEETP